MVLAVNPPLSGDQTAATFQEKAKASSGTPATSPPSSSSSATAQSSGSGTGTASSSSAAATATEPANTGNNNGALSGLHVELGFASVVALVGMVLLA